jgi:sugar phosphate isomerase/epimerase
MAINWTLSGFGDEIAKDLSSQLEVMSKNGISHLEIRSVDGKNILDLSNGELEEVKNTLKKYSFKVSAIGSPIGKVRLTDSFDEHLERFKRALYTAKQLNTKYIRIFSFFMTQEETAVHRDEVIRRLRLFAELAEHEDIILLHENEKGIYGDTPERCLDILQSVNSPSLRATFDTANFVQIKDEPFPKGYHLLKDYIEYIHIKDARLEDGKVMPAGQGDGNFNSLLEQLNTDNFEGFFSFEPHLTSEKDPKGGGEKFALAVKAFKDLVSNIKSVTLK